MGGASEAKRERILSQRRKERQEEDQDHEMSRFAMDRTV